MRERRAAVHGALGLVLGLVCILVAGAPAAAPAPFDHTHAAWTGLLARHVVVADGGNSSRIRYAGFRSERAALDTYREALSRVEPAEFAGWSRPQRLAFLINAYNANTVALVLTRYPDLRSIRDFGIVFDNPFRKRFIRLLGAERHLDEIEHGMIRAEGAYEDARIHFAVNCASIGCPTLREEAYVGERLDAQLEEQTRRFLSDRSRNRYDSGKGTLEVSKIFDWYGDDFARGWNGYRSLQDFFSRHAAVLADSDRDRAAIRSGSPRIRFLDYDWTLNDLR